MGKFVNYLAVRPDTFHPEWNLFFSCLVKIYLTNTIIANLYLQKVDVTISNKTFRYNISVQQ